MYKLIKVLLLLFLISLLFTACSQVSTIPTPEVRVTYFSPLGQYSYPGDTLVVGIDTLYFKVENYVDCRITDMTYVYYAIKKDSVVSPYYHIGFDIFLSGGDQSCEESNITKVYNLWLETDEALSYMYANNDNTKAEITFSGEDDYGKGKTFSCKIYFSLIRTPSVSSKETTFYIKPGANDG